MNGNPANTCVQAGLPAPGALSSSATATRVDSIRDLSTEPRAGDTEIVEDIYED